MVCFRCCWMCWVVKVCMVWLIFVWLLFGWLRFRLMFFSGLLKCVVLVLFSRLWKLLLVIFRRMLGWLDLISRCGFCNRCLLYRQGELVRGGNVGRWCSLCLLSICFRCLGLIVSSLWLVSLVSWVRFSNWFCGNSISRVLMVLFSSIVWIWWVVGSFVLLLILWQVMFSLVSSWRMIWGVCGVLVEVRVVFVMMRLCELDFFLV